MQKEGAAYEKESLQNEARVQKMRDEGRDQYDIKKQEEVLQVRDAELFRARALLRQLAAADRPPVCLPRRAT